MAKSVRIYFLVVAPFGAPMTLKGQIKTKQFYDVTTIIFGLIKSQDILKEDIPEVGIINLNVSTM